MSFVDECPDVECSEHRDDVPIVRVCVACEGLFWGKGREGGEEKKNCEKRKLKRKKKKEKNFTLDFLFVIFFPPSQKKKERALSVRLLFKTTRSRPRF